MWVLSCRSSREPWLEPARCATEAPLRRSELSEGYSSTSWFDFRELSCGPLKRQQHGCVYSQDAASHSQQPGVPAHRQRGRQEGLPHGGHGLLLHHVLHSGKMVLKVFALIPEFQTCSWKKMIIPSLSCSSSFWNPDKSTANFRPSLNPCWCCTSPWTKVSDKWNWRFVKPGKLCARWHETCLCLTQACVRVLLQIYHACEGPGLSILCFMRYDVMEYFSVYGTALSMWVTLIGELQDAGSEADA